LKVCSFLADHSPLRQAVHLKASAVGEDRTVPADKAMETSTPRNELVAWTNQEVIGVPKNDFRARFLEFAMMDRLDGSLRADRHERRCLDDPMRGPQFAVPGGPVGRPKREGESGHTLRYRFR